VLVIPAALLLRSYLPLLHHRPYPLRVTEICHRSRRATSHKPSDTVGEVAWAATTSNYRLRQPTFTEKKLLFRGR